MDCTLTQHKVQVMERWDIPDACNLAPSPSTWPAANCRVFEVTGAPP